MLHQAVELGYRSVLENLNGYCKKTHDIRVLKKQTRRCAPMLGEVFPDDTAEEQRLTGILEDAYSSARYSSNYSVAEEDFTTLLKRVKRFLETAEKVFNITLAK
jgi:HEPN domain-containing protein